MDISILNVEDFDIPKILDIQIECNLSKWTADDYREEIKREDSILLAAKVGGETVGFLTARFVKMNQSGRKSVECAELDLLNFGVFSKFQKKGIGNLLFENLLSKFTVIRLKTIWLEVRKSNLDAVNFYKKRGFTATQTRKNFYRQPIENAVVMKLEWGTPDSKVFNKT